MTMVSTRATGLSESATLALDARAKSMIAEGRRVIRFGVGEPDFDTPEHIVDAAAHAASDPRLHRYTATGGLPELRAAVAEKTQRDSGYAVHPDQVLITNGAKQAVYQAMLTLINPGDEVLIPKPYWTSYPQCVRLVGGVTVSIPTDIGNGFRVSIESLEAAYTGRTKLLVLCSPSNPTGTVYSREQLAEIGRWAVQRGVWILADEIYEHFVYAGSSFHSIPALCPEAAERTIVVNGVSKTYAMTGWRVGWMVADARFVAEAKKVQSHVSSNVNGIAQIAAKAALDGGLEFVRMMSATFDRRLLRMAERLEGLDGVRCPRSDGAFFSFPSVSEALEAGVAGTRCATSADLANFLLEDAGVAAVPGEAFGAPGFLRLSGAVSDDDLEEGLTRIANAWNRRA